MCFPRCRVRVLVNYMDSLTGKAEVVFTVKEVLDSGGLGRG